MAQTAANGNLRSGGQLLMDCLVALGAQKGFGVPGESYLAVLDAMYDHRADFDFIMTRQEGGAAYMAAAWGKLTGAPGPVFCHPWARGDQCLDRRAYRDAGFAADVAVHRTGRC